MFQSILCAGVAYAVKFQLCELSRLTQREREGERERERELQINCVRARVVSKISFATNHSRIYRALAHHLQHNRLTQFHHFSGVTPV